MDMMTGLSSADLADVCLRGTIRDAAPGVRPEVRRGCGGLFAIGRSDDERALIVAADALIQASQRLGYGNEAIYRLEDMLGELILDLAAAHAEREGGTS